MTQVDDTEYFYKVTYEEYGYRQTVRLAVYTRRKILWFYRYTPIDSGVSLGGKYDESDPLIAARIAIQNHLDMAKFAGTLVLNTYLPVD